MWTVKNNMISGPARSAARNLTFSFVLQISYSSMRVRHKTLSMLQGYLNCPRSSMRQASGWKPNRYSRHRSAEVHGTSHAFMCVLEVLQILVAALARRTPCTFFGDCIRFDVRPEKLLTQFRVIVVLGARAHVVRIWFCECGSIQVGRWWVVLY
jgi:hypothetical protein